MARKYKAKKIDFVYEEVGDSFVDLQSQIRDAYNILFEATFEYLRNNKNIKDSKNKILSIDLCKTTAKATMG